jgi:hypothetical protein
MGAETKYMHSGMAGAPTISGTAGHMIALLDACLINGFGSGTVDSIVVSSGVATVTRSAGHPFEQETVAEIAGATPAGLNGQKKVLSFTTTTYTFDATGIPDGSATGTITHKVAALGWTKSFSGTNLAAYKSANPASTACYLRVDDTGTQSCRVVGYETMTDVNTGSGPFPTAAQQSGGAYWWKSDAASAATRSWVLFGDDRSFILYVQWNTSLAANSLTTFFGDIISKKSPDAYGCMLTGESVVPSASIRLADVQYSNNSAQLAWMPRAYTGLGSAVVALKSATPSIGFNGSIASGSSSNSNTYPNPADNGLYVGVMYVHESSGLRGIIPGVYFCLSGVGISVFSQRERVTGVTGLSGKALRALNNTATGGTSAGVAFFDATGPWR